MREFIKWSYRAVRSVPCLGLSGALKLWWCQVAGRDVAIRARGFLHPVVVRGRTTDILVFYGIMVQQQYRADYRGEIRTVIDGGANAGYSAVFLANLYPDAKIVAVEPDPSNFELLLRNTKGYPNVACVRTALWSSSRPVVIANPYNREDSYRCAEAEGDSPESLPGISVRDLMRQQEMDTIDLFKIDIEGGEAEIFSGNPEWLSATRNIFIEIHKEGWKPVFAALEPYEYECRLRQECLLFRLPAVSSGCES